MVVVLILIADINEITLWDWATFKHIILLQDSMQVCKVSSAHLYNST